MTDFRKTLIERKDIALKKLKEAREELEFIDRVIKEHDQISVKKNPPLTEKTLNAYYLKSIIRQALTENRKGIKTKDLHKLTSDYTNTEINYNTFRRYLSEMSNNNFIKQDGEYQWFLNK